MLFVTLPKKTAKTSNLLNKTALYVREVSDEKAAFSRVVDCYLLFSLGFVSQGTASTNVSDVIPQDISWTKANSPYVFNGSVLVGDRCYAQLTCHIGCANSNSCIYCRFDHSCFQ
jgi:hypothetical protein